MKNRKYIISILLTIISVMLIMFSGCKKENENDSSSVPEEQTYTVLFMSGIEEYKKLELKAGDKIEAPEDPVRDCFSFEGWYGDQKFNQKYTFGLMPAQDITLYAKWVADTTVKIQFNTNGGSLVDDMIVDKDTKLKAPLDPTKTGYDFDGWFEDEKLTISYNFDKLPEANIVLYAKWKEKEDYRFVSFILNDNEYVNTPVKKGEKVIAPTLEDGLTCQGWFVDISLKEEFNFENPINENLKLYSIAYTKGLKFSNNAIVGYDGDYENVIIPKTYLGNKITTISDNAFMCANEVTTINLPDSITSIGDYAFYECNYLKEINISKNVTSLGKFAFYNNERLVSFGDISKVNVIQEGTFLGCKKIKNVELCENLTSIGAYAFSGCYSLENIDLPQSVESLGEFAFGSCTSIESIAISEKLTNIGLNAFNDCVSLQNITVAKGNPVYSINDKNLYKDNNKTLVLYMQADKKDTVYVTRDETKILDGAFANNKILKEIVIQNKVKTIEDGILKNVSNLEKLTVPYLGNGEDKQFLAYLFGAEKAEDNGIAGKYVPSSLKELTITNKLTQLPDYAFYGCTGLKVINGIKDVNYYGNYSFAYSGIETFPISEKVDLIGENAFSGCKNLNEITVDANNSKYASFDGCIYDKALKNLKTVPSGKTSIQFPKSIEIIESDAFLDSKVEMLDIPQSVQEIQAHAFVRCNELKEMRIPFIGGSRTENTYLQYIFGGKKIVKMQEDPDTKEEVERVNFENTDSYPYSLKSIDFYGQGDIPDFAFSYCNGLESVTYSDEVVNIGKYAFYKTSLVSSNIGKGVMKIGEFAFASIGSLKGKVVIPGRNIEFGKGVFAYDRNITSVTFEEGVEKIGMGMFISEGETNMFTGVTLYYSALTEINIPSTVTLIDQLAFGFAGYNYNISTNRYDWYHVTVNIAENSKLETIADDSFANSGIREIKIPASVKTIGTRAFLACEYLESVTIGTKEEGSAIEKFGGLSFGHCKDLNDFVIYKDVKTVSDVPVVEDFDFNGKMLNFLHKSSIPHIEVKNANLYKAAKNWADYAKNIYEIA